ncbi:cupredoxin domain-containing protein [Alicyclobacillus pomorum]|uniref:cupredoxin domain-containing protein n=1 Tax=Alicyclobacillus pomorum TaxID=204470 RepID=UPI000400C11B|nr:cupredoxin domain-containing protein [Alicyclobacillus pomorum]
MNRARWTQTLCVVGMLCGFVAAAHDAAGGAACAAVKEPTVEVDLFDNGMSPKTIHARENAPIHLHIVNRGHLQHQFSIPGFYIFTRTLSPGEVSEVEFSPYKLGAFEMTSDPVADGSPEYRGKFDVRS